MLLVLAMAVRSAVPVGWMPVTADTGLRIALCSGQGPILSLGGRPEHHGHGNHHGDHQPSAKDVCPFAMAAQPFDWADENILPAPPVLGAALAGPAFVAARLVAWRSLRPPARGPPVPA
ncbi:MAG: hypothetical protein R3E09_09500 [Novosphingobium sp.]